jgi:hypothetical protein
VSSLTVVAWRPRADERREAGSRRFLGFSE